MTTENRPDWIDDLDLPDPLPEHLKQDCTLDTATLTNRWAKIGSGDLRHLLEVACAAALDAGDTSVATARVIAELREESNRRYAVEYADPNEDLWVEES